MFDPPLQGKVIKIRRLPGHYVGEHEPVVDIRVGIHILTLCAHEAGKVMRCRNVGEVIHAGDPVMEVTGVGTPTWEVFIGYRRSDSPGHAGRLADRLMDEFGPGQVFRDIESLRKGPDYIDEIQKRLQGAIVMIVVIGPRWLDERLKDLDDLHRKEIRTALERGIHVQPVLVAGAHMPQAKDLPEDIRALARRNAHEVSDTRWDYDMRCLAEAIAPTLVESPRRQRFLKQFSEAWPTEPTWQWVTDDPPEEEH